MDTFVLVAVFIIVLWLIAIAYYFYTVRQQADLVDDIEEIQKKLDEDENESAAGDQDS
jgi:Na+/melibiose symporter-like transporter